jgi:hypothetical protein
LQYIDGTVFQEKLVKWKKNQGINQTPEEMKQIGLELLVFFPLLGPGNQFPGGPTCTHNGKEIPCMVEFTQGGGMSGKILTKMLKTLDDLEIFDRNDEKRLFVLLDGHASRFDVHFLEYINDDKHRWSVCIGVPYGTPLRQVGDSMYQNGQFKIRVTMFKEQLLLRRNDLMAKLELIPYDIIPIVNYAWKGSFDNVENNKKAIVDRGWYPLNRMLLLHPDLCKTMTKNILEEEVKQGLFPGKRLGSPEKYEGGIHDLESKAQLSSVVEDFSKKPDQPTTKYPLQQPTTQEDPIQQDSKKNLNFTGNTSSKCLHRLVSNVDFEQARDAIIQNKANGEALHDRIYKIPKMTAASLIITGKTHTLGQHVRDVVKERVNKKHKEAEAKRLCDIEACKKIKRL